MDIGDLRRLAQSLPDETSRRILTEIVEQIAGRGGVQVGAPSNRARAKNLSGYYIDGTTSTTANQEFSIAHGLGRAPYVALPAMGLNSTGTQMVRLRVTRQADSQRVYLASPDVGAPVTLIVEG